MYIKMVGDTAKYHGSIERLGLHLIKVSGLIQHTSGFRLYLDNDVMVGDYSRFIYPYEDPHLGEGVYEYTDNNMKYVEVDNTPTKEEQEKQKIESIVEGSVRDDITSLTEQIAMVNDTLIPMYEVMIQIQEMLLSAQENQEEEVNPIVEEPPIDEETPTNDETIVQMKPRRR